MFLIGEALYLILTIVYIIIGAKRIRGWKPTAIIGNIVIHILMFAIGIFVPGIIESVNEQVATIPKLIENLLPFKI